MVDQSTFHKGNVCISAVTRLLDLPDELLLHICRYLSLADVLQSFYTPEQPHSRLHVVIRDYCESIELSRIVNKEFNIICNLLFRSEHPLRPQSLVLSNEYVTCLIEVFFDNAALLNTRSIFDRLQELTLVDCSTDTIRWLSSNQSKLARLTRFNFTITGGNSHQSDSCFDDEQELLQEFFFGESGCSFQSLSVHTPHGLNLSKVFAPLPTIRDAHLVLQTIDDLYILLDGLVPNAQAVVAHVRQVRLLTCSFPKPTAPCLKLREFVLLDDGIQLQFAHLKTLFALMPNVSDLTMSIRNTPDRLFCLGPAMESALRTHLPRLDRITYTVTHRLTHRYGVGSFTRWPMRIFNYEDGGSQWTHIYSHPWPSSPTDHRSLPYTSTGERAAFSDVQDVEFSGLLLFDTAASFDELSDFWPSVWKIKTPLVIPIPLSRRITTVTLTDRIPTERSGSCVQPFVNQLTVRQRLTGVDDLIALAHCFPNVEYLRLSLPEDMVLFTACFQQLVKRSSQWERESTFERLRYVSAERTDGDDELFVSARRFQWWLQQNTDLKYSSQAFHTHSSYSSLSLWL